MMQSCPMFLLVILCVACWTVSEGQGATYTLTVMADHGAVSVSPEKAEYHEGETVELIPRPDVGYSFSHWSGDLRGRRLVGRVTMDSNKSIVANFQTWQPPIGIPAPEFGIFETYRMYDDPGNRNPDLTYHPSAEGGYYTHYIDNTHPSATDAGNPYGTAATPRLTPPVNPTVIAQGSVVEIHGGPYSKQYGWIVWLDGSEAQPVFFRGVYTEGAEMPVFSGDAFDGYGLLPQGQYFIIENLRMDHAGISVRPRVELDALHHISIRNIENNGAGILKFYDGLATSSEDPDISVHDIIFYANNVGSHGDRTDPGQVDVCGIAPGGRVSNIWILDNHIHHNGGDSIQVNTGGYGHHIYIGRNVMHSDGENAIDIKGTDDVIISDNAMFDYYTDGLGSSGEVVVLHVQSQESGPERNWLINNHIYDANAGISSASGTQSVYMIGNVIHNISGAGIQGWAGGYFHAVGNTICNTGSGILFMSSTAAYIHNNIIANVNDPSAASSEHIYVEYATMSDESAMSHNLLYQYDDSIEIRWGGASYATVAAYQTATGKGVGCLEADPLLQPDYTLASLSPAIDAADSAAVFTTFEALYGIDIRKDIAGRARPQGGGWDIGAYECRLEGIGDLGVSGAGRNSVTLGWTVPGADGSSDRPGRYDIRYAQSPLTEANWAGATQVQGAPEPSDVGQSQSHTLTGLTSGTTYYVGIKTSNDRGTTVSALSNIASGTTTSSGNHAPVFTPIGDRTVAVGEPVTFTVSAADADSDGLTYSAGGLPSGAAFNAATQTFTWTPTNAQSGLYWITFAVTDGQVSISETICITVKQAVNHAPVLAAIGNKSVNEGQTLTFTVSATDSDGDSLTYSASSLPSGSSFVGQTFTWVPTYDQAGSYSVTFTVSDGQSTDSEQITIAVANVAVDQAAPAADPGYPAADEIQVPLNPAISLTVSDAGQGVDAGTVTIRVNDQLVYSGNTASHQSVYGVCRRTGTSASYRYTYQPAASFAFDELVTVRVTASDLAGNAMTPYVYSFTTEMRVFGDNRPASWAPEDLDKSRPATVRDSQGNVWLAYQAGPSGQRDIYVCSLPPGSAYFGSSVQLTTNSADQAYPTIGIGTDDRLYVAWQDNRRGNWDIYISTSSDGLTWSAETRTTDSDDNQIRPVLAVDKQSPNRVHVAWQGDDAGNPDIYIATSSNAFATKTIAQVTTNAADQTAPAIAVDASNNAYLVWTDSRNGASDIYGAASNSGPWTNVPIATGAGHQTAAVIATESAGTMLHFAWVDDAAGNRDIRYASSNGMPSSALAGSNIVDDTSGADQTAPTIATVGSVGNQLGVFVCWVDARNLNPNGWDTDLYLVDVAAGQRTNVLVGDAGTGSDQTEPAVGVDLYGYPYVLWTDNRNAAKYVYYAGSTYMAPEPLAAAPITAATGGTVGTASPTSASHVSAVIPSGASPQDVTVEIAQVLNPQSMVGSNVLAYDFGPSGLEFSRPVTLTIPYPVASFSGGMPVPCWYVSQTGTLSQQGITNPRVIDISSALKALRFETTHFTPYYLLESFVDDGDDDGWSGDDGGGSSGGGGGGGGCSLTPGESGSLAGFLLPYIALAAAMLALRRRDRRRQSARGR